MTEIFTNVSDYIKRVAEDYWKLAQFRKTPVEMAEFLNNATNSCKDICTPEEVDFLRFYFNMKMEMMKND